MINEVKTESVIKIQAGGYINRYWTDKDTILSLETDFLNKIELPNLNLIEMIY